MEERKNTSRNAAMEQKVEELLIEIGVPCHITGFDYLVEAVCLAVEHPEIRHSITKQLYPEIAAKFASEKGRVERAIRHAVENAFNRCSPDILERFFGNSIHPEKGKATNSEFISAMARVIKRRCA